MCSLEEGAPAAPQGVSVTLSGDTFTISRHAVAGADQLSVPHTHAGSHFDFDTNTYANALRRRRRRRYWSRLCDEMFAIDLACGRQIRNIQNPCVRLGRSELSWREAQFNVVWAFSRVVSGGYKFLSDKFFGVKVPVTDLDIAHARATPRFVMCHVPSIDVIEVRREDSGFFIGELALSTDNSCTGETYSIDSITWRANHGDPPVDVYDNIELYSHTTSSSRFDPPSSWIGWQQPLSSVEMWHAAPKRDQRASSEFAVRPARCHYLSGELDVQPRVRAND